MLCKIVNADEGPRSPTNDRKTCMDTVFYHLRLKKDRRATGTTCGMA